jgi:orotidine-5'-phosphate decarboxylase
MNYNPIIVALDVKTKEDALSLVKILGDKIDFYKIGSVLFTHYGPEIIRELKKMNKKVFLDLKYHDIPNTVKSAIKEAVNIGVDMITIHTLGGYTMMKEAQICVEQESREKKIIEPIILGVTVLTSMQEKDLFDIGINRKVSSQVKKLAVLARNSGIKGVVCSSMELPIVKKVNKNFIAVVPGIRPEDSSTNDQKRIATPKSAIENGADYLVIGRPIIEAKNPVEVVENILKTIMFVIPNCNKNLF